MLITFFSNVRKDNEDEKEFAMLLIPYASYLVVRLNSLGITADDVRIVDQMSLVASEAVDDVAPGLSADIDKLMKY